MCNTAQQSILLANALEANGSDVTFLLKANMEHDESKAWPEILEYLKKRWPLQEMGVHTPGQEAQRQKPNDFQF